MLLVAHEHGNLRFIMNMEQSLELNEPQEAASSRSAGWAGSSSAEPATRGRRSTREQTDMRVPSRPQHTDVRPRLGDSVRPTEFVRGDRRERATGNPCTRVLHNEGGTFQGEDPHRDPRGRDAGEPGVTRAPWGASEPRGAGGGPRSRAASTLGVQTGSACHSLCGLPWIFGALDS